VVADGGTKPDGAPEKSPLSAAAVEFFDGLGKPLSYAIPEEWPSLPVPGSLVEVSRRGRSLPALVVEVGPPTFAGKLKPLGRLLFQEPVVGKGVLRLARQLSSYCGSPLHEFLELAVPPFLRGGGTEKIGEFTAVQNVTAASGPPFREVASSPSAISMGSSFGTYLLVGDRGRRLDVYGAAALECLALGKQALFLCAEISTAEWVFRSLSSALDGDIFRERCALWHGSLPDQRRREIWQGLRTGKISILVGTDAALFLPLRWPGLFTVENEEDSGHRSSWGPNFHCRDGAIWRAKLENVPCILGSAAPTLESIHALEIGKFFRWPGEVNFSSAPAKIYPVNVGELDPQDRSLSPFLRGRLRRVLEAGQRAVLLHPSKGFSRTYCPRCTEPLRCSECSGLFTFFSDEKLHRCGHCGRTVAAADVLRCPACNASLRRVGAGIQKIDNLLNRIFPGARHLCCDGDTTSENLRGTPFDILVGTMPLLPKLHGLDIALLALLDVDFLLFPKNFRSSERAFQCFHGLRDHFPGESTEIVLQVSNLEHPALRYFLNGNPNAFYAKELAARESLGYPPFRRLLRQEFRCADAVILEKFSDRWGDFLRRELKFSSGAEHRGPVYPIPRKKKSQYCAVFYIFFPRDRLPLEPLRRIFSRFGELPRGIREILEVDPTDFDCP
jgi:primosomal protein N' (replication factor Y)